MGAATSRRRSARRISPPRSGPPSCPDSRVLRASRSARSISSIARRPAADRTPPAASAARARSRHRRPPASRRCAARCGCRGRRRAASEMSRRSHRPRRDRRGARASSAGAPVPKVTSNAGGVLASDAVPVGGQPHRVEQRRRSARPRHPAPPRCPSPPGAARRIAAYTSRASSTVVAREHAREAPSPQRCSRRCRSQERRTRERRQQEHDAQVRVRPRPARRRLDGQAHGRADARACRRPTAARQSRRRWRGNPRSARRRNGGRARRCPASARSLPAGTRAAPRPRCRSRVACDPDASTPRTSPSRRDLRAGFGRASCGARARPADARRPHRRRRCPWPACSPCQPGMPLTSSTNTDPSRDGSRSTPA